METEPQLSCQNARHPVRDLTRLHLKAKPCPPNKSQGSAGPTATAPAASPPPRKRQLHAILPGPASAFCALPRPLTLDIHSQQVLWVLPIRHTSHLLAAHRRHHHRDVSPRPRLLSLLHFTHSPSSTGSQRPENPRWTRAS